MSGPDSFWAPLLECDLGTLGRLQIRRRLHSVAGQATREEKKISNTISLVVVAVEELVRLKSNVGGKVDYKLQVPSRELIADLA